MKKIIFIVIFSFIMISSVAAVDSSNWNNVTVENHVFKIAPKFNNGDFGKGSYSIPRHHFSLIHINTNQQLSLLYGIDASKQLLGKDYNINNHPTRYFCHHNDETYDGANISVVYFAVGNSIYQLQWKGNDLTNDIKEMIATSDESEISDDTFYELLDGAFVDYKAKKLAEKQKYDYEQYFDAQSKKYDSNSHSSYNDYYTYKTYNYLKYGY